MAVGYVQFDHRVRGPPRLAGRGEASRIRRGKEVTRACTDTGNSMARSLRRGTQRSEFCGADSWGGEGWGRTRRPGDGFGGGSRARPAGGERRRGGGANRFRAAAAGPAARRQRPGRRGPGRGDRAGTGPDGQQPARGGRDAGRPAGLRGQSERGNLGDRSRVDDRGAAPRRRRGQRAARRALRRRQAVLHHRGLQGDRPLRPAGRRGGLDARPGAGRRPHDDRQPRPGHDLHGQPRVGHRVDRGGRGGRPARLAGDLDSRRRRVPGRSRSVAGRHGTVGRHPQRRRRVDHRRGRQDGQRAPGPELRGSEPAGLHPGRRTRARLGFGHQRRRHGRRGPDRDHALRPRPERPARAAGRCGGLCRAAGRRPGGGDRPGDARGGRRVRNRSRFRARLHVLAGACRGAGRAGRRSRCARRRPHVPRLLRQRPRCGPGGSRSCALHGAVVRRAGPGGARARQPGGDARRGCGAFRSRAALHRAQPARHLLPGGGEHRLLPGELERDRLVLAQPGPRHRPRAGLLRPDPDHRCRVQRRRDLGRLHGRESAPVPARGVRRPGRVEPGRARAERQSRLHRPADGDRRAAFRGRPLDARGHHVRRPRPTGRRRHPVSGRRTGAAAGRTTSTSRSPGTSSSGPFASA